MHFLRAVEADAFQKPGVGVYNTSYIRQYTAFIGLDELSNMARYIDFMESVDPAGLPPQLGMLRFGCALRRLFTYFGKDTLPVTVERQRKQQIVDTRDAAHFGRR